MGATQAAEFRAATVRPPIKCLGRSGACAQGRGAGFKPGDLRGHAWGRQIWLCGPAGIGQKRIQGFEGGIAEGGTRCWLIRQRVAARSQHGQQCEQGGHPPACPCQGLRWGGACCQCTGRINVPLRSSAIAWRSSAWVFITIGPCQATGSSIGAPEISKNRTPLGPA